MPLEGRHGLASRQGPHFQRVVAACRRNQLVSGRELDVPDASTVAGESLEQGEVLRVPDLHCFILRGGGDELIVWRDLNRVDVLLVGHDREHCGVYLLVFLV